MSRVELSPQRTSDPKLDISDDFLPQRSTLTKHRPAQTSRFDDILLLAEEVFEVIETDVFDHDFKDLREHVDTTRRVIGTTDQTSKSRLLKETRKAVNNAVLKHYNENGYTIGPTNSPAISITGLLALGNLALEEDEETRKLALTDMLHSPEAELMYFEINPDPFQRDGDEQLLRQLGALEPVLQ